ncbi:MAG: hypothetical protein LC687_07730 [Actinobacteria bacterium]|nr:hypothetical protein [Actinomycetota bacterium]
MFQFVERTVVVAKINLRNFVKSFARNVEAVGVLFLAGVGGTYIYNQLPLYYAMPIWINVSMLSAVLGVMTVMLLTKSAEVRTRRYAYNFGEIPL